MTSFSAVALSPVAVNKFFHTVTSSFVLAALFVVGSARGICCAGANS